MRDRKARKSTQEASARLGRAPTHARIEASEAVRILNGQRSLAHTTHALHRRATHRCLRHGSRLVLHQDGVEPIKFVRAACEARDARWHPDERSWRRWRCLRLALSSSDDAPLAFLGVCDTYEVLIHHIGKETFHGHILASQDYDVPLLGASQSLSLEAGELLASVGRA